MYEFIYMQVKVFFVLNFMQSETLIQKRGNKINSENALLRAALLYSRLLWTWSLS